MSIQHANGLSDCGTEEPKEGDAGLSACDIHTVLSNERRMYFLEELVARDGQAEFNDLVDVVTHRDMEIAKEESGWTDARKTVRTSLYQTHVPRLEDYSIIAYRSPTGTIRLAENYDHLKTYLCERNGSVVGVLSDALRFW